jgi:hypothetical protein
MSGRPPADLVRLVGEGTLPPPRGYEGLPAPDLRVLTVHARRAG